MSSIYEQIGGEPAVTAAVNEFYDRVLHDSVLAPRFDGINLSRLKKHQMEFLTAALGGEDEYSGRELSDAHGNLGITDDEFERVIDHLIATLNHLKVDFATVGVITNKLLPLRDAIVATAVGS